jgi:hypothetical protein
MSSGKTIGVLTFHKCINYGSYWQARCLVEGVRQLGHRAVLLDHESPEITAAEFRCAVQPTLPQRTPKSVRLAYKAKTRRFLDAFSRLPLSDRFTITKPSDAGRFDAVVVGSDEVWNFCHPWYADKPIFFGESLQADRLISYAASFGNHDASRGIASHRAEQLSRFDHISVRDTNSRSLVEAAVQRDVPIVLDPCLQFADRIPLDTDEGGDYAIIYGHSFPTWLHQSVQAWSRRKAVRLISIGYHNDWADEQRIDVGPERFPSLVRGAKAVVTNFFHGCVFSLVARKPFIAVRTDYRSTKVTGLLSQLASDERLVSESISAQEIGDLLDRAPGEALEEIVREHRGRSQAFLDAALV